MERKANEYEEKTGEGISDQIRRLIHLSQEDNRDLMQPRPSQMKLRNIAKQCKSSTKTRRNPGFVAPVKAKVPFYFGKGGMTGTGNMGTRDLVISLREVRRDSLESAAIGVGE